MKKLTFFIIMLAMIAGNSFAQESSASKDRPVDYKTIMVDGYTYQGANRDACNFLVFLDNLPWGSSAVTDILTANGETYTVANSSQMASLDFNLFDVIIIESDQIPQFYTNFEASFSKFDTFVQNGGRLEIHAATCGHNSPCGYSVVLPGGAYTTEDFESNNVVTMPTHPIVAGVPNPFSGTYASHGYFSNLVGGTDIITQGQTSGLPTTIQYGWGLGTVTATCCTYEFGYSYNQDAGIMLQNNLNYSCSGYTPPPSEIPVSDWALYFGIFLIGLFLFFRFRRRLA